MRNMDPLYLKKIQTSVFETIYSTEFKQHFFLECLVLLGVPENENYPKWVAPTFSQPKPKPNKVYFLSNFRNINR